MQDHLASSSNLNLSEEIRQQKLDGVSEVIYKIGLAANDESLEKPDDVQNTYFEQLLILSEKRQDILWLLEDIRINREIVDQLNTELLTLQNPF